MDLLTLQDGEFAGRTVRKTPERPPRVAVYDIIEVVSHAAKPRNVWYDLVDRHPDVASLQGVFQFAGQGQRPTPVTDARGLVTIVNLLPGAKAARFRAKGADIVVRCLGGDETLVAEILRNRELQQDLPEDSPLRIFGEDVEAAGFTPVSIAAVARDVGGHQLYIGLPSGAFRSVPAGAAMLKVGHTSRGLAVRVREHTAAFGGFRLLDHFGGLRNAEAAERLLKQQLQARSMLQRQRHATKTGDDTELVLVSSQEEYRQLYDMAAEAAVLSDAAHDEATSRVEWEVLVALERERTEQARVGVEQARVNLERARMDHEWRMRTYSQQTGPAEPTGPTELVEPTGLTEPAEPAEPAGPAECAQLEGCFDNRKRKFRRARSDGTVVTTYAGVSDAARALQMHKNAVIRGARVCKERGVPVTFKASGSDVWSYVS